MPRPIKWRRIENIPEHRYFIPVNVHEDELEENILKIEELEAIRLKDLEGLDQESCAKRMEISRQTFQRIYNMAKEKVADSLINGKSIRIRGGRYTQRICKLECKECGHIWEKRVEDIEEIIKENLSCPECNSKNVTCDKESKDCRGRGCGGRGRGMGPGLGMGLGRHNGRGGNQNR